MSFCEDLLNVEKSASLICLYFASVLLLLLLIIMQLWKVGYYSENMTKARQDMMVPIAGVEPGRGAFHPGGRLKYSTGFSGANQSTSTGVIPENFLGEADKKEAEWLVNNRGEPDFWQIGSELGAYKRALGAGRFGSAVDEARAIGAGVDAAGMPAQAGPKGEWFLGKVENASDLQKIQGPWVNTGVAMVDEHMENGLESKLHGN